MGVFSVPIEIRAREGSRSERLDALVDTGATFTMVPASVLDGLGVEPEESIEFELADSSVREFRIGEARIRLDGREITTFVVFGEEGITPLLGAYTLEGMMLAVDTPNQRLVRAIGHL